MVRIWKSQTGGRGLESASKKSEGFRIVKNPKDFESLILMTWVPPPYTNIILRIFIEEGSGISFADSDEGVWNQRS
jgi:hypothetical protein